MRQWILAFFLFSKLPDTLFFLHRQWIEDARKNLTYVIEEPLKQITYFNLLKSILHAPVSCFASTAFSSRDCLSMPNEKNRIRLSIRFKIVLVPAANQNFAIFRMFATPIFRRKPFVFASRHYK